MTQGQQSDIVWCQSCGMPMARGEDFGTEADGGKSAEYCVYCYQKGAFTDPGMTMEEMIEVSARGWADHDPNTSYEQALEATKKSTPTLKRWR